MSQKNQNLLVLVICAVILIATARNMISQLGQIASVKARLAESEAAIDELQSKIGLLEEEVKYASSEMGIERNKRQILGMFEQGDIIIKEKVDKVENDLYLGQNNPKEKQNWEKWLEWFTN